MERIDPRELLAVIVKVLDDLEIPYMVTGGMAVLVWGRPRFTADIDVVIELEEKDLKKLELALKKIGEKVYIDFDLMRDALKRKGEFNFIDPYTGVKVDFWIMKGDVFAKSEFQRRKPKKIQNQKVYFISPEDLVIRKLLWYKESESSRHLEDAESVIKISGKKLDKKYLKKWVTSLGLDDLLKKLITNKSK